ncbi:uncharacterized protein LOC126741032 [Anthonomus grandis grandis]|uniref:uncharacterized protein LOC126741032 n=1 Tax=Anthonomus grandis grandis TaxID=2921223 RepID=UPI0021669586|nr:uncharacterized protein LOC126741032 [Anthonomus grandis grandis]
MEQHINRFQEKISQSMEIINKVKGYERIIDSNEVNIHILMVYQLASNFIAEISGYYLILFKILFEQGSIFTILSPAHVHKILQKANEKLPSHLKIRQVPIKTSLQEEGRQWAKIFTHFAIEDISDFNLLKVYPTALHVENNSYWSLDIPNDILAVDYNNQQYFELSHNELTACIHRSSHYLCSPTTVRNIDASPNCVIDEIYQRHQGNSCNITKHNLHTTIWKQLFTPNTWMFISPNPISIAITCNGIREEMVLNTTGIIQLTEACILKTKQNNIIANRFDTVPVVSSYTKTSTFINVSDLHHTETNTISSFSREAVFKVSDDLTNLSIDEQRLDQQLEDKIWKKVTLHSYTAGGCTLLIIILVSCVFLWVIKIRQYKQREPRHKTRETEMVELRPLNIPPAESRESGEYV